jgi:hypothetical protein
MSWYNPSIAKARHEDTPRNPVILATCQVIEKKTSGGGRWPLIATAVTMPALPRPAQAGIRLSPADKFLVHHPRHAENSK